MVKEDRLQVLKSQLSRETNPLMTTAASINSLEDERKLAEFSVRQMTYFLDGGEKYTQLREKIMLEFERDPRFRMDDVHELTKAQIRERIMLRAKTMGHYLSTEPVDVFRLRLNYLSLIDPGFLTRIGVHYGLFMGAVTSSGTPEQVAYWLDKGIMKFGIIGCFGMTELGHGSNVAGIETTATFDASSDEFVIHTPTLTASKWWIGGAAESATHCCVFARMIIGGRHYGVKSFIVPLRDPKDFGLLPGVSIGDCGAKMGRNGIDNGWIRFTHVRVPRSHLLMKHTKVSRDGTVTEPPMAQLTYGALILGRVTMIKESADIGKKALTIAIRYGAVRRQFGGPEAGELETKILDYKTHQERLFPLMAGTFAMHFGAVEVSRIYDALMSKLDVARAGDPSMKEALEALKETHATSACLKAYCSWYALNAIEQCRQACGGNGYSSYAGLAAMYQDFAVQCTWEGDNTVLMLQGGRYLIGCYRDMKRGKRLTSGVAYLTPDNLSKQCGVASGQPLSLDTVSEAFDVVRCHMVMAVGAKFESLLTQQKLKEDQAYEECSITRFNAAKLHSIGYVFQRFKDGIERAPAELKPILSQLCLLFGLRSIQENAGLFLQYNYFKPAHLDFLQDQIFGIYGEIRKVAVPLVDAFNLTDYVLNSPLGAYDGDVYRRLFERVTQFNPPDKPHAYFERILKPLFTQTSADEDEGRLELKEEEEQF